MVVANPESVQLGADAQSLRRRHQSNLRALSALGIGVAGEEADASIHAHLVARSGPYVTVRQSLIPRTTALARFGSSPTFLPLRDALALPSLRGAKRRPAVGGNIELVESG